MKVHHTLICFFFLALQDGNPEGTNAQNIYYGVIGGDVTVPHAFQSSGTLKMFCREECEGENILINTTDVRAQSGRYSIEYKKELGLTVYVLYVSISKLTESDSGQYSCGLGGSSSSASYRLFRLVVAEALLDGNDDPAQLKHFYKEPGSSLTVGCSFKHSRSKKYFCRGECGGANVLVQTRKGEAQRDRYSIGYASHTDPGVVYVSITQLTESDSGQYRCYLSGSFRVFEVTVTDAVVSTTAQSFTSISRSSTPLPASTGTTEQSGQSQSETTTGGVSGTQTSSQTAADVLLYVGLTLAVTIIIILVAVLTLCKKRSSKVKDPVMEIIHSVITDDEDDSRTVKIFSDSAPYSHTNEVNYSAPWDVHYENWTSTK